MPRHSLSLILPPVIGLLCAVGHAAPETPAVPKPADPEPSAPSEERPKPEPQKSEPPKPKSPKPEPAGLPETITPQDWLVLPRVGEYRRAPLHVDPVEAAIARGGWEPPRAGETVTSVKGEEVAWRDDAEPRTADLAGGYAYAEFDSPAEGVLLLEAKGCAAVCVNGEWLPGDPYGVGWFRPPVRVQKGANRIVAHLARPTAKPRLVRPAAEHQLLADEATLPDLVVDPALNEQARHASILFVNASDQPQIGGALVARWAGEGGAARPTVLDRLESRMITSIPFTLPDFPADLKVGETATLLVDLMAEKPSKTDSPAKPLATARLELRAVGPAEARTNTFVSELDGSVQPYGVLPASTPGGDAGVLVVLHDAGQTHRDCLDEHTPRPRTHLIAPYGRGRFGFDWEDWSAGDALEALDDFVLQQKQAKRPVDADKIALTGRGMGGHGALSLATLHPDRFAAVGVTDGWISFFTQRGSLATPRDAAPIARLLGRQASANDPLRAIENLAGMGVSVWSLGRRGVARNESRFLRERLGEFHNDFAYREIDAERPLKETLREQADWLTKRRRRDHGSADQIELATPDVGVLSRLGWVTIQSPDRQGEIARVELRRDAERGEVVGVTDNVRRLRISFTDWDAGKKDVRVKLDGAAPVLYRPRRDGDAISLASNGRGVWTRVRDLTDSADPIRGPGRIGGLFKGPERSGGVKPALMRRPLLVYGTRGPQAARAWAAAKARYDAQLFLYRGAGRLTVWPDRSYVGRIRRGLVEIDRTVVMYGNAETNTAWSLLRQEAFLRRQRTVGVENGRATLGRRPEAGDDLALVAVRPRPGDPRSGLIVIGGSGPVGMRMTTRLRYFWAGVNYPDYLLYGPEAISPPAGATPEDDVRAAGYFDTDWGVESGGILWRDLAI
ncbi:hypothetical protein MalM25_02140 [Planctomycetes bacterium MalM25]|nr:hypothetical protein MalM25_02140 [Planctomycetes bacterium MalM25]